MKITRSMLRKMISECMSDEMDMYMDDESEMYDSPEQEGRSMGSGGDASMARGQLFRTAQKAQSLFDRLSDDDTLPEWVQYKITLANEYISTAEDYLSYTIARHDMGDPLPAYESRSHRLSRLREEVADATAGKEIQAGTNVTKAEQLLKKMPSLAPVFKQIDTSKEIAGMIQAIVEYAIETGGVDQREVVSALNSALSAAKSPKKA